MNPTPSEPKEEVVKDRGLTVTLAQGGPTFGMVVTGICLVGIVVIWIRVSHKDTKTDTSLVQPSAVFKSALVTPRPLEVPPAPMAQPTPPPAPSVVYVEQPAPPPVVQYIERPAPPVQEPPRRSVEMNRLGEPALVVDLGGGSVSEAGGDESAFHAVPLKSRSMLVSQGTLIPAVIETPIDTAAAGPVRALTIADTRSFDGNRILIPRGSRLTGQVVELQQGGRRLIITWSRLVRPDGVTIRLAAPSTSRLGQAGVGGVVNDQRVARFANMALQTAISVGTSLASRPAKGSTYVGLPNMMMPPMLNDQNDQPRRTIKIAGGTEISVFVTRDLDFSGSMARQ